MVGVPALAWCACGPSSRMYWPIWRRRRRSIIQGPRSEHEEERGQARHRGAERDVADDVEGRDLVAEGVEEVVEHAALPLAEARHERVHDRLELHAARALHEHGVARPHETAAAAAAAASASAKWRRRRRRACPPPRAPSRNSAASGPTPTTTSHAAARAPRPCSRCSAGPRRARARACRRGRPRAGGPAARARADHRRVERRPGSSCSSRR